MATKKGLTKGIACFIVLGLLGIGWAQEVKAQKGQEKVLEKTSIGQENSIGPRIMLEEEEIILFDEKGKEVRRISDEEQEIVRKEIKDKVFKKLRVKSGEEVSEKKLCEKYNEEIDKLIKVKKLDRPRLKFIDKEGKVIKEISLGEKRIPKRLKDAVKNKEWNGYQSFYKYATVSKNQKYAAIGEYSREVRWNIDNPKETEEYVKTYGEEAYVGPKAKDSKLTLFDSAGIILLEKKFSEGTVVREVVISEEGKVAVITDLYEGAPGALYVYDKTGKEILVYPKENEKVSLCEILKISPNGRYLAVDAGFRRTIFFDLKKGKKWIANKNYVVYEINDEGKVTLDYYDEIKKKPSMTEIIDITKYLGE